MINVKLGLVEGLVLARKGSKGLPGKNIKILGPAPLISHSIAAGLLANSINDTYFSSDCDEMIKIANKMGAKVPFIRPSKISEDFATDLDVIKHFLNWYHENIGYVPEYIVQLRPTLPYRKIKWIEDCINLALEHKYDCIRTISDVNQTPYKMWLRKDDGMINPFAQIDGIQESFNLPRQLLPRVFYHTGQIDVIKSSLVLENNSLTGQKIYGYETINRYNIDIDTLEDFVDAERNFNILCDPIIKDYLE